MFYTCWYDESLGSIFEICPQKYELEQNTAAATCQHWQGQITQGHQED